MQQSITTIQPKTMQQNLALSTPTTAQNMPLPTELNPTDLTLTSSPPSTSLCAGSSQAVLLQTARAEVYNQNNP